MSDPAPQRKEFHLCLLGLEQVGKTSWLNRLVGKKFSRNKAYTATVPDEPVKNILEVTTSAGIVLFNLYDWSWGIKTKEGSINQALMKGPEGFVFMYDITDKRTFREFSDQKDWFSRACGFDKSVLIIGNKNDQKGIAVKAVEGASLARQSDNRSFLEISLANDFNIDESVLQLTRLFLIDTNVTVLKYGVASEESVAWSEMQSLNKLSTMGLGMNLKVDKCKRVLLLSLNSSVTEKFVDALKGTQYSVVQVGSVSGFDEEFDESGFEIVCLICPPTASDNQKKGMAEVAEKRGVKSVVSIPKNAVGSLAEAGVN